MKFTVVIKIIVRLFVQGV